MNNSNPMIDNSVVEVVESLDEEIEDLVETATDAIAQLYNNNMSENLNGVSYGEMNTPHFH